MKTSIDTLLDEWHRSQFVAWAQYIKAVIKYSKRQGVHVECIHYSTHTLGQVYHIFQHACKFEYKFLHSGQMVSSQYIFNSHFLPSSRNPILLSNPEYTAMNIFCTLKECTLML